MMPTLVNATAVSATGDSLGLQAASDIVLGGVNFEGWNVNVATSIPAVTTGAGITVSSITYVNATTVRASVIITTNASAGYQSITLTNPDGQVANVLSSSFSVTVPTTTINLPAGTVSYSNPTANYVQTLSTVTGGAGTYWGGAAFGGTLTGAQVLVQKYGGNYWSGNSFSQSTRSLGWQNATSGTSAWNYYPSGLFASQLVHQSSYTIWARALSSDGGTGVDGSSVTVIVDLKDPVSDGGTLSPTFPLANGLINSFSSISGLVEDPTSGVLAGTVSLRLIDLGIMSGGSPQGPDLYWNGYR
jgi:hypothetical protein